MVSARAGNTSALLLENGGTLRVPVKDWLVFINGAAVSGQPTRLRLTAPPAGATTCVALTAAHKALRPSAVPSRIAMAALHGLVATSALSILGGDGILKRSGTEIWMLPNINRNINNLFLRLFIRLL